MSEVVGLIRIDKIGDLISTLPVDQVSAFKNKKVVWAINQGLIDVVKHASPAREGSEIENLSDFKKWIRANQITTAIVFFAPWWVYFGLWWERVPVRIGRRSKWYSFLFLNKGLRQSRSQSAKHEADYNLDLVTWGLGGSETQAPVLKLTPPLQRHLLEKHGLQSQEFFVVHPGMAGSAVNWGQQNYISAIRKLIEKGTVVITGTQADSESLTEIANEFKNHPRVRWLQGALNLPSLFYILSQARCVLVPSTGVAHLAASLNVKVIGLYPNNTLQSPTRWAARGDKVVILDIEKAGVGSVVEECLR